MPQEQGSSQLNAKYTEYNGMSNLDETNDIELLELSEDEPVELVEIDDQAKADSGILPVSPDKLSENRGFDRSIRYRTPDTRGRGPAGDEFALAGNGVKHSECGHLIKLHGCLNALGHPDGNVRVRQVHASCNRLSCPVCAPKAMTRAADRITHRIVSWWTAHRRWRYYPKDRQHWLKPIHVVVAPSEATWTRYSGNYPRLRDVATEQAKNAGVIGGAMIYHPFRHADYGVESTQLDDMQRVDLGKGWYYSPHFHVIGFGWIKPLDEFSGWIVKNLGVRGESPEEHRIFELARYQLSHCGVSESYNSFTWIGELSTRCYTAPPMAKAKPDTCPVCGAFMYPVEWTSVLGLEPPRVIDPDAGEACYSESPLGWRYVGGNHA